MKSKEKVVLSQEIKKRNENEKCRNKHSKMPACVVGGMCYFVQERGCAAKRDLVRIPQTVVPGGMDTDGFSMLIQGDVPRGDAA